MYGISDSFLGGGEILTHPTPIKPHEFQECSSLISVVRTKTHTKQCCFSLHESFPKFLPARPVKPAAVQFGNSKNEAKIRLRPTKRQPQDKMPNMVLSPLLVQLCRFSGVALERDIFYALIPYNLLQLVKWPVAGP